MLKIQMNVHLEEIRKTRGLDMFALKLQDRSTEKYQ